MERPATVSPLNLPARLHIVIIFLNGTVPKPTLGPIGPNFNIWTFCFLVLGQIPSQLFQFELIYIFSLTKLSEKTPPGAVLWILHPFSRWLVKKLAALPHLTVTFGVSVTFQQGPWPMLLASPGAPQLKPVRVRHNATLLAVRTGWWLALIYRSFVPKCLTLEDVLHCWVIIVRSPVQHVQFFFFKWIPESGRICRIHGVVLKLAVFLVNIVQSWGLILVTDLKIERFVYSLCDLISENLGLWILAVVCLGWDCDSVLPVAYLGFNAVFVMGCRVSVGAVVSWVGFAGGFFLKSLAVVADHLPSDHCVVVH
jgi:hypothetical protein